MLKWTKSPSIRILRTNYNLAIHVQKVLKNPPVRTGTVYSHLFNVSFVFNGNYFMDQICSFSVLFYFYCVLDKASASFTVFMRVLRRALNSLFYVTERSFTHLTP
jgi:hypothetical protein